MNSNKQKLGDKYYDIVIPVLKRRRWCPARGLVVLPFELRPRLVLVLTLGKCSINIGSLSHCLTGEDKGQVPAGMDYYPLDVPERGRHVRT